MAETGTRGPQRLVRTVYPHAAYRIALAVRDPMRAEQVNLLLDAVLLGAWTA